jgi:hypothetical protein
MMHLFFGMASVSGLRMVTKHRHGFCNPEGYILHWILSERGQFPCHRRKGKAVAEAVSRALPKGFCRSLLTSLLLLTRDPSDRRRLGVSSPTHYTDHRVRVYTSERDASASSYLLSYLNNKALNKILKIIFFFKILIIS